MASFAFVSVEHNIQSSVNGDFSGDASGRLLVYTKNRKGEKPAPHGISDKTSVNNDGNLLNTVEYYAHLPRKVSIQEIMLG